MIELAIKQTGIKKLQQGLPYLLKEDFFEQLPKQGTLIQVIEKEQIYYGYIGKGHKSDIAFLKEPLSQAYFEKVLTNALQKRLRSFSTLPQAYRLIHNEADHIPGLSIEIFQHYAVITYFNQGIIKFETELILALTKTIELKGVYAKYRLPGDEKKMQVIWGKEAPENIHIEEKVGTYIVKLNDGQMNGLFLDQRANRVWLANNSEGKSVCNTFSYTGALSIACALGGAKTTSSVDLSGPYNQWCQENIELNNLDTSKHSTITKDTFAHFDFCRRNNVKYDMIILDPPTFAKKKSGSFSVAENYRDLISQALPLLNQHGYLICATNYTQWSAQEFNDMITRTGQKYGYKLDLIYAAHADKDFPSHPNWPESNHLKFLVFEKT